MLGQVLTAGEGLPTCDTGMGLLPRVSQNMAPQVLVADEGLATHPTLVGSWHRLTIVVEAPCRTPRAATSTMTSAALSRVVTGGGGGNHRGGNTTTPWWVDGHNPPALVGGLQQQGRCQAWCVRVAAGWGAVRARRLGVAQKMFGQMLPPRKCLVAGGAVVRLLPRVGEGVATHMFIASESLATHGTLIRPRGQVNPAVTVQVCLPLEGDPTVVASVWLIHTVLVHHVFLKL